ncbi:hypothetical protein ABK040_014756 [Willaertia magna]
MNRKKASSSSSLQRREIPNNNEELISFYTRSFAILNDALINPPNNFPLRIILDSIKQDLINGWKSIEERKLTDFDINKLEKQEQTFIKDLSDRIKLKDASSYKIYIDYLSSETPSEFEFNEHNLEKVVNFYFSERVLIIECITILIKMDREGNHACQEIIKFLIENKIEENLINLYDESSDIENFINQLKFENLNDKSIEGKRKGQMIEQKLIEQATVLDCLFMLYSKLKCESRRFFDLLNKFDSKDFGNNFRNLTNMPTSGFQIITRIVSISVLIVIQILNINSLVLTLNSDLIEELIDENEIMKIHPRFAASINDIFMKLSGNEPHHGSLMIVWSTYALLSKLEIDTTDLLELARNGRKANGLVYLAKMFDRDNSLLFYKNYLNEYFYREVVKGAISGVFFLYNFNTDPYPLIQEVFSVTEAVVHPNQLSDRKIEYMLKRFSEFDIELKPYSDLFVFFKSVFPAKIELIRLLNLMCFNVESTKKVIESLNNQKTYCMEMSHSDLKAICGIDEKNSNDWDQKASLLETVFTFSDETTNQLIPEGVRCMVVSQTQERVLVCFDIQTSGWKILFSQLLLVLQNKISIDNAQVRQSVHSFLELLHKVLYFGEDNCHIEMDRILREVLDEQNQSSMNRQQTTRREESSYRGITLQLLSNCLKYFSSFPIPSIPIDIINSCCKCLNAFATIVPVETAHHINLLIQKYHLANVLRQECLNGRYFATLSLLDVIYTLSNNHPAPMNNVYDMLPFVCSNIFSVHDSWRYQKLEERWLIAKKTLQIFNRIIDDSSWVDERKGSRVNTYGGRQLLNAFFNDSSLYQVLFLLVGLDGIMKYEKNDDISVVRDLLIESLSLLEQLLKFRQNTKTNDNITPFEEVLFSKLLGREQVPLITSIFEFIAYRHSQKLRIISCRVINLIAQLSESHKRLPSLVGYLGNQSTTLVGKCLYQLRSIGESDEFRVSMLELIATTVEIQRGLAELFLNCIPSDIMIAQKKTEGSVTPSDQLPKDGCLSTIISILKDADNLVSKRKTDVIKSALNVIYSIFQSGDHRSQTIKLLKNHTDFWDSLFHIIQYQTKKKTRANIDIVRSIYYILSISAVDMYNLRVLKSEENSSNGTENKISESAVEKEMFSKNSNILQDLLKSSIENIILSTNRNVSVIRAIEISLQTEAHRLGHEIHLNDYVLETNVDTDVLYDVKKIKRWEHGINEEILREINELNASVALEDAYITLIRALHSLFAVSIESTILISLSDRFYFQRLIEILLIGLKISQPLESMETMETAFKYMLNETKETTEFGENLDPVTYPLPIILDNLITKFHFEVSSMLANVIRKMITVYPLSEMENREYSTENLVKLSEILNVQVLRKKLDVCRELLGSLLIYYLELGTDVGYRNCSLLIPTLFHIVKNFDRNDISSEIALSILSVCVQITFTEEQANYFCNQLSEAISQFDGLNESNAKFTINCLNLILSLSFTKPGSTAIILNNVVTKLTNCTILSTGADKHFGLVYFEGERTYWHQAWRLSLKLVTSLLNSFDNPNQFRRNYADTTFGQMYTYLQQCYDFCNSHKNRLILGLTELWDKRPLTLALIEEVELTSMLVNALSRLKVLQELSYLVDASLIAMVKCIEAVKHFHLILSKVTPITSHERKLHDLEKHYKEESTAMAQAAFSKTKRIVKPSLSSEYHSFFHAEQSPFVSHTYQEFKNLYQGRETLNWNTQIDLTVFGTLQSLLSSIRNLTILPIDDGMESSVEPQLVLSIVNQTPNIRDVFRCIEACVDTLKIVSSSKYTGDINVVKTPTSSGTSTPTTVSPTSSTTSSERLNREQESLLKTRILVSKVVVGTLNEALHVSFTHLMLYEYLAENEVQIQLARELMSDLQTLYINKFLPTLKKLLSASWFFTKFGETLLKPTIKFMEELAQLNK